jgi:S1-C subfamily serine protease
MSAAELYKSVEKSVFVVVATATLADARARNVLQGSAVAVSDNLLLTNCHVVEGRPLIKILQDKTVDDATLVAAEPKSDRCVIKASTLKLVPVAGITSFDSLAVGTRAFAIGAPRSLERTLSEGLVSGLRHQPGRNLVQTSAAVSPGSSGGGLFDEHGNLIGITTLGSNSGAQNLNFAISAADYWE